MINKPDLTRRDWLAFAGLGLVIFAFLFPVFTFQKGFLSGDHWEQQYPWAFFMQQQIRDGFLPWWTSRIGCGFPILAEGQIGAFYPLNWIFYWLFPIKIAYSGIILFQYFLGAFLFFVYAKRLRFSISACVFSALIYLFGSCQGGYFYYNFISQKVVIWLPLTLILLDRLKDGGGWRDAVVLGTVLAIEMFGGYLQVAIYTWVFTFFYFLYFFIRKPSRRLFVLSAAAAIIAITSSLVQIIPTFELVSASSRALIPKEFAYVGSMNPLGFLTLIYPSWDGWLQSELYVSLIGLFFVICGFFQKKNNHQIFFIGAAIFFTLLALGRFSPLYRAIVELTHFSGFRTPIKFLFFTGFSLSLLAGYGWDSFFEGTPEVRRKAFKIFLWLVLPVLLLSLAGPIFLSFFRDQGLGYINDYIQKYIFNQPGHPHTLEAYFLKASGFYDAVIQFIGWGDFFTRSQSFLAIILLSLLGVSSYSKVNPRIVKIGCMLFLLGDLFFYGATSIRANFEDYQKVDRTVTSDTKLQVTSRDDGLYRVMDFYIENDDTRQFPLFPSQNMLYSRDQLGIYTPLAWSSLREYIGGWGYINDSVQSRPVEPVSFFKHLEELSWMNVKYVFSLKPINNTQLIERNSITPFIYENAQVKPRIFFFPQDQLPGELAGLKGADIEEVKVVSMEQMSSHVQFESQRPGWLIWTEMDYPGWIVSVNQAKGQIERFANLFRAVHIPSQGNWSVQFTYAPSIKRWIPIWMCVWTLLLLFSFYRLAVAPLLQLARRN